MLKPSNSTEFGSMLFSLFYPVGNLPAPVTDPHSEASATPRYLVCHPGLVPYSKREERQYSSLCSLHRMPDPTLPPKFLP